VCQTERVKVVRSSRLNIMTGAETLQGSETVLEVCGTPLFGDKGPCRACRGGWSHPDNHPATEEEKS